MLELYILLEFQSTKIVIVVKGVVTYVKISMNFSLANSKPRRELSSHVNMLSTLDVRQASEIEHEGKVGEQSRETGTVAIMTCQLRTRADIRQYGERIGKD